MSPAWQTVVALAIVALAAIALLIGWFRKRRKPGCGNDACSAVSPEVKELQSRLKR
jgi:uncharacterized protein YciW